MNRSIIIDRRIRLLSTALILSMLMIMVCGCSASGAEARVKEDLEALRTMNIDTGTIDELNSILNDDDRGYLDGFLTKAESFDCKITGSEPAGDGSTIVTLRIRTYDFGRKYIETWADYIADNGDADFDQSEFYGLLMKNLSGAEDKDFYKYVDVICTQSQDGVWQSDAANNLELKDALLGGLMTEIAALAEAGRQ